MSVRSTANLNRASPTYDSTCRIARQILRTHHVMDLTYVWDVQLTHVGPSAPINSCQPKLTVQLVLKRTRTPQLDYLLDDDR